MIAQELRRKCAKRCHEATQQAVENVLLDPFITGTAEKVEDMKNALFFHIETNPSTLAEKRTKHDVFNRSIERWTQ